MLFLAVEASSYRANMLQINELIALLEKPKPAPEHNMCSGAGFGAGLGWFFQQGELTTKHTAGLRVSFQSEIKPSTFKCSLM